MANFYNLSGGGAQATTNTPVPPTLFAVNIAAQESTISWDETSAVGSIIQIQYCKGTVGTGTVTTEEGDALTGTATVFDEELVAGDWIVVVNETAQIESVTDADEATLVGDYSTVVEGGDFGSLGTWTDLASVPEGVETYTHSSLDASSPYFYRMRIFYKTKWSDWSDPVGGFTEAEG